MSTELERERDELRNVTADFLAKAQDLGAVRRSLDEGYDRDVWRRMAQELGLTAVGLPESVGGTGESLADLAVITEELGRHLDPGPFLPSIVLGARVLAALDVDEAWIGDILAGKRTVSVVAPEIASLGASNQLAARREGEVIVVEGIAENVVHGDTVDDYLLVVTMPEGLTFARLDVKAPGLHIETVASVDGTRPLADLTFTAVPVEILGEPGTAASVLGSVLVEARIAMAAELVGAAQGALDLTVAYAKERHQFGRAIGSFQSIKHLLVDVMMDIEASRTAVRHAARAVDANDPESCSLSYLCQAVASDAAMKAGKAAVQVHGAIGFTWEHDAHLFLKRAMSGAQLLGSARENRAALAALLLDNDKTGSASATATPGEK